MIRTVLGDIKKEELGVTTAHEHVYSDLRPLVDAMDPIVLKDLALKSGLNVIMGCIQTI